VTTIENANDLRIFNKKNLFQTNEIGFCKLGM
jgi:hypothetical protein